MYKKIFSIFLFLMLIASLLIVYTTYHVKASGDTYYVGGNEPGNYSSIQSAIDVANPGDTVFVYSGTYFENIFVNKSINLFGENRSNTIIDSDGENDIINISANSVIVRGFTICNSSFKNGIAINSSNNNVITNNNILSNYWNGILISYSNNITISDNYIQNNNGGIVFAFSCENNIILNNIINENDAGLSLVSSNNNTISGNTIKSSQWYGVILGYLGYSSNENKISGNTIELSGWSGIYHYKGHKTIISGNNIHSNNEYGIILNSSNNISITNNNIKENLHGGISVDSSDNINISFNTISQNTNFGLNLIYNCNKNKIYQNNFLENNVNAYFRDSFNNNWNANYWDDWIGLKTQFLIWFPKLIFGNYGAIPWLNFDWNPSIKLYDIPELA